MFRRTGMGFLAVLAFAASLAFAQGPPPPDFGPDLSPDQKTRLRSVMEDARNDTRALYGRLKAARRQLTGLYESYSLDHRRIHDTARAMNRIQNDIILRHYRTQQEIRRIVSPAQFEQMKRHMEARKRRDHERKSRHRRGDRDVD